MKFLIVFPISDTRLHIMYDTLEGIQRDSILSPYIEQIIRLDVHQHALINYRYFIERIV